MKKLASTDWQISMDSSRFPTRASAIRNLTARRIAGS
jgi:hypothetical protein